MNLEELQQLWTPNLSEAATLEGWFLYYDALRDLLQVHCETDQELLAEGELLLFGDDQALLMVRTGTGEHHSVARKLIYTHYPAEWALMEKVAQAFQPK